MMAKFDTSGLDSLMLDMAEIEMLDDSVLKRMLESGAEVLRKAHTAAIQKLFTGGTGKLSQAPTVIKSMKTSGNQRYMVIYPKGEHHRNKNGNVQQSQDIAFVHEYGGHGNTPTQWMRKANEEHIEEAVEAEFDVLDKWFKEHNL